MEGKIVPKHTLTGLVSVALPLGSQTWRISEYLIDINYITTCIILQKSKMFYSCKEEFFCAWVNYLNRDYFYLY